MNKPVDQMTQEEMIAEIARLKEEAVALKGKPAGLSFKVTEKGGVSVYGLGRFPVTLYKSQWERLIAHIEGVKAFLTENASKLTDKAG